MAQPSLKEFLERSERYLGVLWTLHSGKTRTQRLVAAMEHDGVFESRVDIVQPGMFSHLRRSEAAWVYLLLAGIPQTSTHTAAALARGMVKSRAQDEYKATSSMLSYGRDVGRLRRYGLRHWTVNMTPVRAREERHRQRRLLKLVARNGRRVA